MPRAAPIIPALNRGEVSKNIWGRVDLATYSAMLKRCENFLPTIEGPLIKRGGTQFIREVKNSSQRTWLIPFQFNVEQTYQLEFGNFYVRFHTQRGTVLSGPVPYEIATPYPASDLTGSRNTLALKHLQSKDVMYLCNGRHFPQQLSRLGPTNWTIGNFPFVNGPFKDQNPNDAITVYANAETGAVTLTANSAIFQAGHVGSQFYIEEWDPGGGVAPWEVNKAITAGNLRRSDGKTYVALNNGTTGSVRPVHVERKAWDGDTATAVQWEYLHAGFGTVQITGFTSSTIVTGTVLNRIPASCVGLANATPKWAHGAFSAVEGYPVMATFWRGRLIFAKDLTLYMSVAGDFANFATTTAGQVLSDNAVIVTLDSEQSNPIEWLAPQEGLVIGTSGEEFIVSEQTTQQPFGPDNFKINPQTSYGSRSVQPVKIDDALLFAQRSGRKLRDFGYQFSNDNYRARDVAVLSKHLTKTGITQLAYQQEPDSIVWATRNDGKLIGHIHNKDQDVLSWFPVTIGGTGDIGNNPPKIESICVTAAPDGLSDELTIITRRYINGQLRRYIEWLHPYHEEGDDPSDSFYVDCGSTYNGAPATVISGLDYLEGELVAILADGAVEHQQRVIGGQITLQSPASKVHVGPGYSAIAVTMPLEAGAASGTAQGKTKRIHRLAIRIFDMLGIKYGPTLTDLIEHYFRKPANSMDKVPPYFTGDIDVTWHGGYEIEGGIVLVSDQPLPCQISSLMPILDTNER